MNRFTRYKIRACLWFPLLVLSFGLIIVLELTKWRPLGYSANAEGTNRILVTLSYSIIDASLFHLFNNILPFSAKSYVTKEVVKRQIWNIKEQLRLLVEVDLHPFSIGAKSKCISKESYVADFGSTNLTERSPWSQSETKETLINNRMDSIVKMSGELLTSYLHVLNETQLDFLNRVFKSTFAVEGLRPTLWTEHNKPIVCYKDNQEQIGECIYDLYECSLHI